MTGAASGDERKRVSARAASGSRAEAVSAAAKKVVGCTSAGIVPTNVAHMKPKKGTNAAARRAKGERQARIRAKVFTKEQLFIFLKTAWEHAPEYLPLFFLLARTGLRIGEALALKIADLDFANRLINVQRNKIGRAHV